MLIWLPKGIYVCVVLLKSAIITAVKMSENDPLLGERRSQLQGTPPETQVCFVSGNSNNGETADGPSDVLVKLQHDDEYSEQGIPPEIHTIRLVVDFT